MKLINFRLWCASACFIVILSRHGFSQPDEAPVFKNISFLIDGVAVFQVEVEETKAGLEKGLMYRHAMPADRGMLFVFPEEKDHVFWMKNTFIPLDLIFLDSNYMVVGIIENARPESLVHLRIDKPSRYVVELNGGTIKKWGIKTGIKALLSANAND